jgi:hypothetical protein
MKELATALVIIFCTPFGWCGLMVLGIVISMIIESINK